MMELIESLLEYTHNYISDEPLVFSLPVRASSTCWNNILTQEEKDKLIFTGRCGECKAVHEYPKCDKCRTTRMQSGNYQSCCYIKPEEEYYNSYCGNCFQMHEFPNCVECQHYRLKPGRCANCGALGPDDIQWEDSCLDEDQDYERLMQPILEKRDLDIKMNSKKFKTYDNCPLCRGYFHSAKACIFRKHALHFNDIKKQIQQNVKDACHTRHTELLLPKISMAFTFEEPEEDNSDEEEERQPILTFDKILKALQYLQVHDSKTSASQTMDIGKEETYSVQPTQCQDTSCELTRKKFQSSICKILPNTVDFPEDLFNVEGCVWCGSKGHSVLDCLGYATWLNQYFHLDQHEISYEEKLQMKKRIIARAREYHNPRRPWELYIGKDNGEYWTEKGVKILVKDKKIVNLVPRHLQTATTTCADFPAPDEVRVMLKL